MEQVISKHYIEEKNKNVRRGINVNPWRNTEEVIPWFKGTEIRKGALSLNSTL